MHSDDIRTFLAVAEARSISVAAHDLHVTQPAVTRRIQRLEDAIGAPLIDRRTRPFALTDVGRAAVERCRRLLFTTDELRSLARSGTLPSRDLRIGVAHALTELALIEPVDELRRADPLVSVRLHTGWSRDLLARVRSGSLDSAVILLPDREGTPGGVIAHPLAHEYLAIVGPRSSRRGAYRVRELGDVGWILNPEGCGARAELQRELARVRVALRVSVETYNYELQLRLIARGRGLGLVPGRLLKRSPIRSRLRALRVRGLDFPLTIWLVTGDLAPSLQSAVAVFDRALRTRLSARSVEARASAQAFR